MGRRRLKVPTISRCTLRLTRKRHKGYWEREGLGGYEGLGHEIQVKLVETETVKMLVSRDALLQM
jgi:hypothetical protein